MWCDYSRDVYCCMVVKCFQPYSHKRRVGVSKRTRMACGKKCELLFRSLIWRKDVTNTRKNHSHPLFETWYSLSIASSWGFLTFSVLVTVSFFMSDEVLTNQLSISWTRVFQKLIVSQVLKKFAYIYGTWQFSTPC